MSPDPPGTLFADITGGYPRLPKNVRGHLRRAGRRLAEDRAAAVIRFDATPAGVSRLRPEITAAWHARNTAAGRPCNEAAFREVYGQAREIGTLRISGQIAAWVLTVPGPVTYLVLAGQMTPGFERYSPGRLLEAVLLGRALAAGCLFVDWGSADHAGSLITVS